MAIGFAVDGNTRATRKRLLVDHGVGALKYVSETKGVTVTADAQAYLAERLEKDFTDVPYRQYFEEQDKNTINRFRAGVESVTELAISIAQSNNRNFVTRVDIEKAIRAKFCNTFPFCK